MTTGEWVNEPAADPMVTTSLRLPVELMQAVRAMAAREGLKPTALIRRWVEDAISGRSGSEAAKDDLQGVVREGRPGAGAAGQRGGPRRHQGPPREGKDGHAHGRG